MAFSVVMPALEMAQETGKLVAWRKQEGDRVTKGEPLLEVETDKAVLEVEAPADGILAGIKASAGTDIPVGQTIAWIVAPGEKLPTEDATQGVPAARATSATKTEPVAPASIAADSAPTRGGARISPKARRLAKELGVDITTVEGSGADGEILAADVQTAAAAPGNTAASKQSRIEVPSSIGRLMAERTTQSWTTVPHFFVSREVEASELNAYREGVVAETERTHGVRIMHTDLLVALVARVDLTDPNTNIGNNRLTRFIGGASYQLAPNLRVLADLDMLSYQGGAPTPALEATRSQAYFQAQFTF